VLLATDAVVAALSLWAAYLLRFDGVIPGDRLEGLPWLALLVAASRFASNRFFRLHRWSFRFSGLADGARLAASGVAGTGLFTLALYLLQPQPMPPRSVILIELLLSTAAMAVLRFLPRLLLIYQIDIKRARRAGGAIKTLIVGAGAAGELLLRDLQQSDEHPYSVVGFVDDDLGKRGHVVGGRAVLGSIADLPLLVPRLGVRQILIAIPRLPAQRVREILSQCSHLSLQFKILPVSYIYLQERGAPSMLQELTPEDLLEREVVTFSHAESARDVRGRIQLVTGAAGSIGSETCAQLLAAGGRIVMLDVDENGLYVTHRRLEREYGGGTAIVEVGDVRDVSRLEAVFRRHRPQDVFHAAARKHVPLMEQAPCEAVKTNVTGTWNVARMAREFGVDRFVLTSTDKAVRPTSVMGATKRLAELLVEELGTGGETRFSVVRFGNVLDSAASVVPLFRDQIAAGGPVTVTHPEVRRYFMTIPEAVGLVLRAAYGDYGKLCVLDMGEPMKIADLARLMITMSGRVPDEDVKIEYIGLRPGEKLDEELLGEGEVEVRRAESRIQVVESPAPPPRLFENLEDLSRAAAVEDDAEVLRLLRRLLPDYQSSALTETASGTIVVSELALRFGA